MMHLIGKILLTAKHHLKDFFKRRNTMETLIKNVLDKYRRKKMTNVELAKLIVAHMKVGVDDKKGWYLNLNTLDGQHDIAEEFIETFKG